MNIETARQVPGDFELIRWDLPAFRGDWTWLALGDPLAERTASLRAEYRLEEVVAGFASEWEQLLALKRWVRSRWDHGWSPGPAAPQDALEILRAAERGAQFSCGFYARVFVECACALGFVARLVSVGVRDGAFPRGAHYGNVGHSASEAWSNTHQKWVLLDCDLNLHYARDGVPLSALEVHDAWLSGEAETVAAVQDDPPFVVPGEEGLEPLRAAPEFAHFTAETVRSLWERFTRHQAMDYYARLRVGERTWLDRRCPPVFVHHFAPAAPGLLTDNPDDLYPTLNLVRLAVRADWQNGPRLSLTLEHCMPWFHHYEIRIDGGEWQETPAAFDWPMREGRNILEVRAVNACRRAGRVSRLEIGYASPLWNP